MASLGLTVFNAYVDARNTTDKDKAALKARAERLYLDVYRELPALLGVLGDAAVVAKPTDTKLAERQAAFKGWYAEMEITGGMIQQDIIGRLEGTT